MVNFPTFYPKSFLSKRIMKSLKLPVLLLLFSSLFSLVQSQSAQYMRMINFSNTIYESGNDVTMMPNRDLILVGNSSKCTGSSCNHAAAIVRTSPDGDVKWVTKMGNGGKNMTAMATCIGNDGNLMMASHYGSNSILTKVDTSGQVIWHQMIQAKGNFWPRSVIGAHNAYFVVGELYDGTGGNTIRAGYIARVEEDGTFGWVKFFQLPGSLSQFHRILLTSAGELVVTGSGPSNPDRRLAMIFFDPQGSITDAWGFKDINEDTYPLIEDMILTSDNGYLLSVRGNNNHSFCLVKLQASGAIDWAKRYRSTPAPSQIVPVVEDHFGGYLVMGTRNFFSNSSYFMTMKIDQSGEFVWGMDTDNPNEDRIHRVLPADNCGYVLAGMSEGTGAASWMIAKADSSGKTGAETSTFQRPSMYDITLQKDTLAITELAYPTTILSPSLLVAYPHTILDQSLNYTATPACNQATALSPKTSLSWKIGPNPVNDWLQVETEAGIQQGNIVIYDLQGRQLQAWHLAGSESRFYLGDLPAGAYEIVLKSGERAGRRLLIKQ